MRIDTSPGAYWWQYSRMQPRTRELARCGGLAPRCGWGERCVHCCGSIRGSTRQKSSVSARCTRQGGAHRIGLVLVPAPMRTSGLAVVEELG